MYNNKTYNTRNSSGRYNTPGQFVSAGEINQQQQQQQQQQYNNPVNQQRAVTKENLQMLQTTDAEMNQMQDDMQSECSATTTVSRPPWMKSKLDGVKKISNKERRRRQNENLRRLLTPKNALMVLNEMLPNEQLTQQFKIEPAPPAPGYYRPNNTTNFVADLSVEGHNYKGYGENKMVARNNAAEQAIRDLMLRKMQKIANADNVMAVLEGASQNGDSPDEETLPMIQLASFALHKLFSEWEYEGHKVPALKPHTSSESGAAANVQPPIGKPLVKKELPTNASSMHPCMLLTYMRPRLEYKELAVEGDRPGALQFTIGVDVDGATYIGKAASKKEARKNAAKAACTAIFNMQFNEHATDNAPILAQ